MAIADKFGNISIQRLQKDASDDVQDDPSGQKAIWSRGHLNGAQQKSDKIASFYTDFNTSNFELKADTKLFTVG